MPEVQPVACSNVPLFTAIANAGKSPDATIAWYATAPLGWLEPDWWKLYSTVHPHGQAAIALHHLWAGGASLVLLVLAAVSLSVAAARKFQRRSATDAANLALFNTPLILLLATALLLAYNGAMAVAAVHQNTVIRSLPGPEGAVIAHVSAGTIVDAGVTKGDYLWVHADDASGWLLADDQVPLAALLDHCP